jgi:hypothetical protein
VIFFGVITVHIVFCDSALILASPARIPESYFSVHFPAIRYILASSRKFNFYFEPFCPIQILADNTKSEVQNLTRLVFQKSERLIFFC